MSATSPNHDRRDYDIPCRLLPETELDLSEGLTPEQRAGIGVGGLARSETLHDVVELDGGGQDSLSENQTMTGHETLESFYEDCEHRLGLGVRGDVSDLLSRTELWVLIWLTIYELGKLGVKRTIRLLVDDVFGRKNLTAEEAYEVLAELKDRLRELNAKFNRQQGLLAELRETLLATERSALAETIVTNLVERGWDRAKAEKGIRGVLDELGSERE